ncbi:MAG: stage III sporulation protein AA [Clostridia bacterium]|nr:stage III sporulation protein AA [Clostridia bacterium]
MDHHPCDPVIEQICPALPPRAREAVRAITPAMRARLTEIRLRRGRTVMGSAPEGDFHVCSNGCLLADARSAQPGVQPVFVSEGEWEAALRLVTDCSIYAVEHELAEGFVTIRGGHRVGLVGRAVLDEGRVRTQRDLSSMNYRVARQILGAADGLMPYILGPDRSGPESALVLSAPGLGKTTVLRDIARCLSWGIDRAEQGSDAMPAREGKVTRAWTVGVADERSEIAACIDGVPQNDVGPRADVLDGCPKAKGIMMLIRSMSPQVIVTDEIGRDEDVEAIAEAARCGVAVIASAHAGGLEDAFKRRPLGQILGSGIFRIAIVLGRSLGLGTCERVMDLSTGADLAPHPFRLGNAAPGGGR